MANWTQRGELVFPIGLSAAVKTAIAQAYVNQARLETLENELLMFDKAAPASADWGATETHRRISTALFPALSDALSAAIPTPADGLWYVLNDAGELVSTNDPARLSAGTITHGLDWQVSGVSYAKGELVRYQGQVYECIQAHTTAGDPNWNPALAKSLWKPYLPPGEVTVWQQPTGAHNAYPKGARVLHKDSVWVNQIDANVWEPGSVGAESLWLKEGAQPPVTEPAWAAGVKYTGDNTAGTGKGDVVTYNGRRYRCWQTHTSQVGWEPPRVPALWIDLGPI